jgi:hypothetical protein
MLPPHSRQVIPAAKSPPPTSWSIRPSPNIISQLNAVLCPNDAEEVTMRILLALLCLLLSAGATTSPPTVAIRHVNVVGVTDGAIQPEQTVLIAGNRIVAVGPADEVQIPSDAELLPTV